MNSRPNVLTPQFLASHPTVADNVNNLNPVLLADEELDSEETLSFELSSSEMEFMENHRCNSPTCEYCNPDKGYHEDTSSEDDGYGPMDISDDEELYAEIDQLLESPIPSSDDPQVPDAPRKRLFVPNNGMVFNVWKNAWEGPFVAGLDADPSPYKPPRPIVPLKRKRDETAAESFHNEVTRLKKKRKFE